MIKIYHLCDKSAVSTPHNDKHAFVGSRPFSRVPHLPSLERHVRELTAEKTQHCAQGYWWKLKGNLYLPARESEDLGGGESLSAASHKASLCASDAWRTGEQSSNYARVVKEDLNVDLSAIAATEAFIKSRRKDEARVINQVKCHAHWRRRQWIQRLLISGLRSLQL